MTTPEAQGELAQSTATGQSIAAVDDLTDAFLTGEAPAEIERLTAALDVKPVKEAEVSVEQKKSGEQAETVETVATESKTETQEAEAAIQEGKLPELEVETQSQEAGALPEKIRLKGDDMRINLLVKNSDGKLSYAQAEAIVKGPVATEQSETAAAEPAEIASQKVDDLRNEYATVQAQLDQAAENETLFTPEIRALQRKERELEVQISQAETEVTQAASTQQKAINDQRTASFNTATELYSDLKKQDSPLWKEANRIATDPTHPDYDADRNSSTKAPMTIAKIAAANLGIKAGTAPSAPVISSVPTEQSTVRPASGQQSTAPKPPKLSPQEIARKSEEATLDVIENGRTAGQVAQDRPYILM